MPEDRVTYKEMVEYVTGMVRDVKAHAEAHDNWHRDLAERDAARRRADVLSSVGLGLTFVISVVSIVLRLTGKG